MKCFFCDGTGIDAEKDVLQGVKKCVPCNSTGIILRQYLVDNIIEAATNHFPYWRANGPSDIEKHRKVLEPLVCFLYYKKDSLIEHIIQDKYEILTPGKIATTILKSMTFISNYNPDKYPIWDLIEYLKKDGKCEN
jgi:hypothetical protein